MNRKFPTWLWLLRKVNIYTIAVFMYFCLFEFRLTSTIKLKHTQARAHAHTHMHTTINLIHLHTHIINKQIISETSL